MALGDDLLARELHLPEMIYSTEIDQSSNKDSVISHGPDE